MRQNGIEGQDVVPGGMLSRLAARMGVALVLSALAACATAPRPGEARIPEGATVTHRAAFIGESNHDTTGTVSLYESGEAPVIVFETNFDLGTQADAVVALGRDGYRPEAVLGELYRPAGRQAYAVPAGIGIHAYNEVWIWSTGTNRPLGLARLTRL